MAAWFWSSAFLLKFLEPVTSRARRFRQLQKSDGRNPTPIMAGLVPAIPTMIAKLCRYYRDARVKPAHDGDFSHFNGHLAVDQERRIDLDRHHAGRRHHFAGTHVELAVVEIALDDVVFEIAFGERARSVGATIVGDKKLAVDVEYGKRQVAGLDLQRRPRRHIVGAAELDTLAGGHQRNPRTFPYERVPLYKTPRIMKYPERSAIEESAQGDR